jgi:hypothetical protein
VILAPHRASVSIFASDYAHVAEHFRLLSWMGWGQPKSAGHYIDLASAILGSTLLSLGTIGSIIKHNYDPES